MDKKQIQTDEYSLQYYGLNAPIIIQRLFDSFMITIGDHIDASEEEFLLEYSKPKTLCVFKNLRKEYLKNIINIMNEKEKELRNLLLIPPHVLLPEDKCYSKTYKEEEVNCLKNEVDDLEKLYLEKKACKCIYEKELDLLENFITSYDDLNGFVLKLNKIKNAKSKLNKLYNKYEKCVNVLMEELDLDVEELMF